MVRLQHLRKMRNHGSLWPLQKVYLVASDILSILKANQAVKHRDLEVINGIG